MLWRIAINDMQTLKTDNVALQAEVVELFEKDGRRVAKVLVHSFFLEVDADHLAGAHLGDSVILNSGRVAAPTSDGPIQPPRPVSAKARRGESRRS